MPQARADIDAAIPDGDILFEQTPAESTALYAYLRTHSGLAEADAMVEPAKRIYILKHATQGTKALARTQPDYEQARTLHRSAVKSDLSKAIVRDQIMTSKMDENLGEFRSYLAEHLPELGRDQ